MAVQLDSLLQKVRDTPDPDLSPMSKHKPATVFLPTVSWTDACDEVAAQLGPQDELLVVHDSEEDPVADREHIPETVRLVVAGTPTGCSGKANAIAAGMEAASHDRLVWTDDDFDHPPNWLDGLKGDSVLHKDG